MAIDYTTSPMNYHELVDSVRGQVERTRELKMMGETISPEECVTMTSESMLSLLDRMETMSEIIAHQAHMFVQIEGMFRMVFNQVGMGDASEED